MYPKIICDIRIVSIDLKIQAMTNEILRMMMGLFLDRENFGRGIHRGARLQETKSFNNFEHRYVERSLKKADNWKFPLQP